MYLARLMDRIVDLENIGDLPLVRYVDVFEDKSIAREYHRALYRVSMRFFNWFFFFSMKINFY